MKKVYFAFLLILILINLFGCGPLPEGRTEDPTYTYEYVEATIIKLDTRHWFAGTHRYEWYIEVYYEPYNLRYNESSWNTGLFGCPSFFYKSQGDLVNVEVCNKYIDGKLIERKIHRIK